MEKQTVLKVIILLSIIGLLTSLYLVKNHYGPLTNDAPCDFGETVSCSLVNTSRYSELFHVPVAIFGVLWFVILGLMSWRAMKKEELITGILLWSLLGVAFIFYMILAEILLRSLCIFCSIVHIIVIIVFIFIVKLRKKIGIRFPYDMLKEVLKPWAAAIIVINIIPLMLFNIFPPEEVNYDDFAKCLTDKGVIMYSSYRCGVCTKNKELFGDSFRFINHVECHPWGEHSQTELCVEKGIEGTPTWILEKDGVEVKRKSKFLSIEGLKKFSGCE